ncbi:MAG: hypothetical protein GTO24_21210 [candidate division Zixibacteria bacterium]|nr:hypothetical protein [candidate division Zixibacteria bacterium]
MKIISDIRLEQLLNTLRNMGSELTKYGLRAAEAGQMEVFDKIHNAQNSVTVALINLAAIKESGEENEREEGDLEVRSSNG